MRPSILSLSVLVGALTMFVETAARPTDPTDVSTRASLVLAVPPKVSVRGTVELPLFASTAPECIRERRRFWVEDEGWIVRRVSTCRYQSTDVADAHLCSNEQNGRSNLLASLGRAQCH
jgi:hypothetical protein